MNRGWDTRQQAALIAAIEKIAVNLSDIHKISVDLADIRKFLAELVQKKQDRP